MNYINLTTITQKINAVCPSMLYITLFRDNGSVFFHQICTIIFYITPLIATSMFFSRYLFFRVFGNGFLEILC